MSRPEINLPVAVAMMVAAAVLVHADLFQLPVNMFIDDQVDCAAASSIINSCADVMPTWSSASLEERAQCLCCDGSTWDPGVLDEPIESCYEYLTDEAPASTESISIYSDLQDICSWVGPVTCMAASNPTEGVTGTTACASAASVIGFCQSEIPNFQDASSEELAACICYDEFEWTPEKFDGYISSCLTWAQTASPTYYSSNTPLLGFCSDVGPIITGTPTTGLTRITDESNTSPDGGSGLRTGAIGGLSTRTVIATQTEAGSGADDSARQVGMPGSVCAFITWILSLYIFV